MSAAGSLGVGVVGCGWAAGEIVRAIGKIDALHVVTVFDANAERAEEFAARVGRAAAQSLEDLLGRRDVDLVYIGLPHNLIAPVAERVLAAGKHVLAEKPLALDGETARRLGQTAAAKGLKLSVFFELRRSATVSAAKSIVESGAIGEVHLVRLRTIIDKPLRYWGTSESPLWRARKADAGGGVIFMNTIHQLDTLRYLTGLEFVAAEGQIATFTAAAEVEDTGSAVLRMNNGAIVSIVAAAHSPGAKDEETIEIDGAGGRLDLPDPFGEAPLRLFRRDVGAWQTMPVERTDSYVGMLEAIAGSILNGTPEPATASDAAAVIDAISAIYRSASAGGLVTIPGDG
ncbi:MAG: Gfo/Idh/MocA family oxidoreductase [Hyphomicrobiaceae bacterium]|nr:Gfo/Idh/MocA family oxidoreductase [Hyphomicrobiaceae bacterium]